VSAKAAVPPGPSRVRVDGRTARAQRTRRAMVDALLALIAEGDLLASPERIVERAGVSLRTLWTNFKDLEGLYAAVDERLLELLRDAHESIPTKLALSERIRVFCEQRGRLLELAAPATRASQLRLPYSAQLRHNRQAHHRRSCEELRTVFAAELDPMAAGDRDRVVLDLAVNTSPAAWLLLRDELAMTKQAATDVLIRSVTALLVD
jgi:TetR/AcrR family transcriptional regulator, regulator of autoinduction and epiphytic fitness